MDRLSISRRTLAVHVDISVLAQTEAVPAKKNMLPLFDFSARAAGHGDAHIIIHKELQRRARDSITLETSASPAQRTF